MNTITAPRPSRTWAGSKRRRRRTL